MIRAQLHVHLVGVALLIADGVVLLGYLLSRPGSWLLFGSLWAATVSYLSLREDYRIRLRMTVVDDLSAVARHAASVTALIVIVIWWRHGPTALGVFLAVAGAGVVGHVAVHGLVLAAFRRVWRSGRGRLRTLFVGDGVVSQRMATVIGSQPGYGLDVLGYVDDAYSVDDAHSAETVPISGYVCQGTTEDLHVLVHRLRVEVLVVSVTARTNDRVMRLVDEERSFVPVILLVQLSESKGHRSHRYAIGDTPLSQRS